MTKAKQCKKKATKKSHKFNKFQVSLYFIFGLLCIALAGIGIGIKMILLPVVLGKLLLLTPLPTWIVYATALTIALPTMTVVPMIASLYGKEGAYTSGITVVTLLAGIFTLPLVAGLIG